MIHKEPTLEEQKRIQKNWNLMSKQQQEISDRKSIDLFGLNNKDHNELIMQDKIQIKKQITDWGIVYYFNNMHYKFALYMYNDDNESIYLSNVCVYQQYRHLGYGNKLLQQVEKIVKKMNRKNIYLLCKKESFVYEWYKRNGFKDFKLDKDMIWLEKTL